MENNILKNAVCEAVRRLRLRLGDTQQQFAQRLELAISTVVRYELTRPPRGKVLARFERLATELAADEEASVFRDALERELGLSHQVRVLRFPVAPEFSHDMIPSTANEAELIADVLWIVRRSGDDALIRKLDRLLAPARKRRQEELDIVHAEFGTMSSIVRLVAEGKSDEEIQAIFPRERFLKGIEAARPLFKQPNPSDLEAVMEQALLQMLVGASDEFITGKYGISAEGVALIRRLLEGRLSRSHKQRLKVSIPLTPPEAAK